jgi:hypothetical protein
MTLNSGLAHLLYNLVTSLSRKVSNEAHLHCSDRSSAAYAFSRTSSANFSPNECTCIRHAVRLEHDGAHSLRLVRAAAPRAWTRVRRKGRAAAIGGTHPASIMLLKNLLQISYLRLGARVIACNQALRTGLDLS